MQRRPNRRVRFIRKYQTYAPGDVITPIPRLYDVLVDRGFAVPADGIETTMLDPATERAVQPRGRARRLVERR